MAHRWDPRAGTPGLTRPVRVDPSGLTGPTRRAASGPHWRRTSLGLYVPASVDGSLPEQRILEQSARLPARGAVTGWAACRLHGAAWMDGLARDGHTPLPVPFLVGPHGNVRGDGVRLCCRPLADAERWTRYGISTVSVLRATYDAMLYAHDLREAVVVLDSVAAAGLASIRTAREYAERQPRDRPLLMTAIGLASEHSRSPNEVRLRLVWLLDCRLPRPLVNCVLLDEDGIVIGEVDLFDPESGLVIEFDGADHRLARRQTADVRKEERLRAAGLEVTRVTGLQLLDHQTLAAHLLAARQRALRLPRDLWTWTVRPRRDDLHQRIEERELRRHLSLG